MAVLTPRARLHHLGDRVCYEWLMKKLLGVAAIAFALFFLLTQPQAAADAVRGGVNVVAGAFNALITFVTALFR